MVGIHTSGILCLLTDPQLLGAVFLAPQGLQDPTRVNGQDQWGAFNFAEAEDLGRVQMSVSESEATEQLTIGIEAGEGPNGTLSIVWDTTAATLPIMAH